jgi:hypothetical protein
MTANADQRTDELLGALQEYRAARQRLLDVLGPASPTATRSPSSPNTSSPR